MVLGSTDLCFYGHVRLHEQHVIELSCSWSDISDHFPIFYIDKSLTNTNCPKYLKKRMYSVENQEKFACLLRERNWSDVLSSEDPQSAYSLFSQGYIDMYNECFPLRTVKSGYKTRKPWLSEGLKKSIERKNKLYNRKQKTKNPEHEIIYKKYRNKLNKLMSIVEREYYEHRLQENKQIWRLLGVSWRKYLIKIRIICHVRGSMSITRYVMIKNALQKALIHFLWMLDPIWRKIFHQILGLQRVIWSVTQVVWPLYWQVKMKL